MGPRRPPRGVDDTRDGAPEGPSGAVREEEGRLSNPVGAAPTRRVQRRLTPTETDEMLAAYDAGDRVIDIAARFGVSRTTVIDHVGRRGLPRRSDAGWSDDELRAAANLYANGHALAAVGHQFGVDASTVANRFRRAGLPVRRRRGWS